MGIQKMRVGIDISPIVYGTGVSIYTKNLVENLLRLDEKDTYRLFGGSFRDFFKLKKLIAGFDTVKRVYPLPPFLLDILWNRLHTMPFEVFAGKVDVYHSSDWTQAPSRAFKVTTVHDLVPIKFASQSHPRIVAVHKRRLAWIKKEVDRVIAVSKSTKADLVNLGIDKKKIKVVYEAASEEFKPVDSKTVETVLKDFGVRNDYVMSVGFGPRKNTDRIIEAFQKTKTKNLKLVFVGRTPEKGFDERSVITLNQVDSAKQLTALYSGAKALIYPSLYEGFGLPVVEAMSCGCPVVTSNTSSLPEVAGDAAVLVDPTSTNEIADGIQEVLKNSKKYISKGKKQSAMFSWKKTAEETRSIYKAATK